MVKTPFRLFCPLPDPFSQRRGAEKESRMAKEITLLSKQSWHCQSPKAKGHLEKALLATNNESWRLATECCRSEACFADAIWLRIHLIRESV
jgi:hypothetical protein